MLEILIFADSHIGEWEMMALHEEICQGPSLSLVIPFKLHHQSSPWLMFSLFCSDNNNNNCKRLLPRRVGSVNLDFLFLQVSRGLSAFQVPRAFCSLL
jgi:hypothetical protein